MILFVLNNGNGVAQTNKRERARAFPRYWMIDEGLHAAVVR